MRELIRFCCLTALPTQSGSKRERIVSFQIEDPPYDNIKQTFLRIWVDPREECRGNHRPILRIHQNEPVWDQRFSHDSILNFLTPKKICFLYPPFFTQYYKFHQLIKNEFDIHHVLGVDVIRMPFYFEGEPRILVPQFESEAIGVAVSISGFSLNPFFSNSIDLVRERRAEKIDQKEFVFCHRVALSCENPGVCVPVYVPSAPQQSTHWLWRRWPTGLQCR